MFILALLTLILKISQ
ncbi:hypothetical protein MCJ35_30770 [Enterocloster sp. OA13]|nr:hypothetical protein [Enterocloster sp. OA13]